MNRAEIIHGNFIRRVMARDFPGDNHHLKPADAGLADREVIDLFESQVMSRLLDIVARRLRSRNESYYTIGSAGHEGNAVIGKVFRYTDMAFLHYRDCALLIQRSKQLPGETPLYDILLSFVASSEDPVSAGRHKVLGSHTLFIPPQTSTIASHLPKAVGAAYSIGLAKKLNTADALLPHDSVILCSFGDASVNHSTALGAFNAAGWTAFQNIPMPIVFICEDNGTGISVRTPPGWVRESFSNRPGITYLSCDGLNLLDTFSTARAAADHARIQRKPVFLHLRTVRLMGHAGSDVEAGYLSAAEIEQTEAQDPLLHTARILVENDIRTPAQCCELYTGMMMHIEDLAGQVIRRPKLNSARAVMASIAPERPALPPVAPAAAEQRISLFARDGHLLVQPQPMGRQINMALADILLRYRNTLVFGEDVGRKGGVYGITGGLQQKFGPARVFDTLLDEQSILGLAIGLAHNGFIPIPEIQFLAYVHNAEDQIRGEAATLSFFSNGRYSNPMVVRIAGLAYQKGFGGHFHNDNSLAVFRDIPGIVLACPSNGADAVKMLFACIAEARRRRRVVIFIEPIALYQTRDLYEAGDSLWTSMYELPADDNGIAIGEFAVNGNGSDLCIISYGNGYYLGLQAARILRERYGIEGRTIDLRWLAPIDTHALLKAAAGCRHILIVDECRRSGSPSEGLMTLFLEQGIGDRCARITAEDSFIPLAEAAGLVLPDVDRIVQSVLNLVNYGAVADAPIGGG
jgi:2-oxoisovalerate dehydrogenase E1 component